MILREIERPMDGDSGKVMSGPRMNCDYGLGSHDEWDLMNLSGRFMGDRRVRKNGHRRGQCFPKTAAHPGHSIEAFVDRGPYSAFHAMSDRRFRQTEVYGLLVPEKSTLPAAQCGQLIIALHPETVTYARPVV